jgi:glycosyltransferase involved in cell wall biosynthesis
MAFDSTRHITIAYDARLFDLPGIGRVVCQTLVALVAKPRVDLSILLIGSAHHREALEDIVAHAEHQSVRVRFMDSSPFSIGEQLEMRQIIRSEQVDLWHSPHFNVPLLAPCRVVWTVNDLIPILFPDSNSSLAATAYCRCMYFLASHRVDKILSISDVTREALQSRYPCSRDKCETIYFGLDHNAGGATLQENGRGGVDIPEKYILYVGTYKPWKNLGRLLNALAIVKQQLPCVTLILVGKQGKRKENIEDSIADLGLVHNVMMLGSVDETALDDLYARATIVVCPSIVEGFGFAGLEAMKRGAAVLASDIPVFREVYQDGCGYFDPYRPEAIAEAILALLSDESKRSEYRIRGRSVASKYVWGNHIMRLLQVYSNVVARPGTEDRK